MKLDEETGDSSEAEPSCDTKIVQVSLPKEHKAKLLIWSDLTVSDMDVLNMATSADDVKRELARIFELDDYMTNLKTEILMDLYFYVIQFARDNNFAKEKTSTLFSIVKRVHEMCIETPFGNIEFCYRHFRELLLCHAVRRPPFSLDIFTPDDVQVITEFVVDSYFRHFKLYKYAYTPMVRLDLTMAYTGLPPTPVPSEYDETTGEGLIMSADGDTMQDEVSMQLETSGESSNQEESPAAKELRELIRKHLGEELAKLKSSMEEQLKTTEETINRKLQTVERTGSVKGKGKRK
ncbi:hypothetical protein NP493_98g05011 [Ridgeia piscesae]|uniref:Coiled-coil domain-containing protein 189 n=1 Tax=Ridgeia piscesae TaxID=27915 RepID=A0AAD9P831_RIDPI|nr:hypothetical protein NP493_98g05011 [Ridgeia piscesae]